MSEAGLAQLSAAATDYARRGYSVVPMNGEKHPAIRWKRYQSEPAGPSCIARWFKPGSLGQKVRGVGIVLGEVSGWLVVRDFDVAGAYERWAAEHPDQARTLPTVKTARGFHVYATISDCPNRKLDDGELRATGAAVVCPPSIHPSGVVYRWIVPLPDGAVPRANPRVFGIRGDDSQSETAPELWHESPECPGYLVSLVSDKDPEDWISESVATTVPVGVGHRNDAVFRFARRVAAHPELRGLDSRSLVPIVRQWYEAAVDVIATKDFDATRADFMHAWQRIRVPYGMGMADALEVAKGASDPPCANAYDEPATRLLVRLCRELQTRFGDGPFFLGCREAGGAIGLDRDTASRRLGLLVCDGVLELTRKGHRGRSSEYRYLGE